MITIVYYNSKRKAAYFNIRKCIEDFMCPSLCIECPIAQIKTQSMYTDCEQFIIENLNKALPLMNVKSFNSLTELRGNYDVKILYRRLH